MNKFSNWYWRVKGYEGQVFSTGRAGFVPDTNKDYLAWTKHPMTNAHLMADLGELSETLIGLGVSTAGLPKEHQVWSIKKTDIWLAMTDQEAAQAQGLLNSMKETSPRLYRLFADAEIIESTTDFYPQLRGAFVSLYGEGRTVELLGEPA